MNCQVIIHKLLFLNGYYNSLYFEDLNYCSSHVSFYFSIKKRTVYSTVLREESMKKIYQKNNSLFFWCFYHTEYLWTVCEQKMKIIWRNTVGQKILCNKYAKFLCQIKRFEKVNYSTIFFQYHNLTITFREASGH